MAASTMTERLGLRNLDDASLSTDFGGCDGGAGPRSAAAPSTTLGAGPSAASNGAPIPPPPWRPPFKPSPGVLTLHVRDLFLEREIRAGRLPPDCRRDGAVTGLVASARPGDRLFPWQIYSLTGRDPVRDLVAAFYRRVAADDAADWFRAPFHQLASFEYHVTAQTLLYLDCFGGGRLYWGGHDRLDWHHRHEAAVLAIMTARGAARWMHHMRAALAERGAALGAVDPRLRGAVADFLRLFMAKYAAEYGFSEVAIDFGPTEAAAGAATTDSASPMGDDPTPTAFTVRERIDRPSSGPGQEEMHSPS